MTSSKPARLPLELALTYVLPLPPLAAGLLWAVVFSGISWSLAKYEQVALLITTADGGVEPTILAVLLFVASLMLGMLPAIFRMSMAAEEWERQTKPPPIEFKKKWQAERQLLAEATPTFKDLLGLTTLGVVIGLIIVSWIIGWNQWGTLPGRPALAWASAQLLVLFVLLARGMHFARFSHKRRLPIYQAAEQVDLADLEPQYRAARTALRSAITWLAGASFSSLFMLIGSNPITNGVLTVVTLVGIASLMPTVIRLKNRIRQAKDSEIRRLRERLRDLRPQDQITDPSTRPGEIADLLAYLDYLESLPELPFDKHKAAVVSLYFAVPLGSWLWITALQKLLSLTLA